MTKTEAIAEYRKYILPEVRRTYERDGRIDGPARAEAWNNFTDALHQDGQITTKQVNTWTHPGAVKRKSRKKGSGSPLRRRPVGGTWW